jgi:hypothetical protein
MGMAGEAMPASRQPVEKERSMRQFLLTIALSGTVAAGMAEAALADCVHETVAEASTPVEVAEEAGTSQTSASGIPGAIDVAAGTGQSNRGVSRPVSQPVIPTGTPMRQPITPRVPQPPAPAR